MIWRARGKRDKLPARNVANYRPTVKPDSGNTPIWQTRTVRCASGPMFLPSPGGRFPVGAITFRLAVPRHPVSSVKVRSGASSELKHALMLEEVAFTAYYPADVPPRSVPGGISWLLRPLRASLQGYSNYSGLSLWLLWPVVYIFGNLLKIPVHHGAPLLNPYDITPTDSARSSPWPLVIFSHGLGGSRTAYSQLCTSIASSGRVVLAMEHRDGSAHAAMPSLSEPIPYIKESSLIWPSDYPAEHCDMLHFRGEQLVFRRREIYYALCAMRNLVRGGRDDTRCSLETTGNTCIDWSKWSTVGSEKPIECDSDVVLAGHSFGGATVLSILSNAPPENEPPIPVQKALILDPWLEPLPSPRLLPRQGFAGEDLPNILVINSEAFTLWKDHFERLMEVGKSWTQGRWKLLTIVRSKHISFSDFSVLPLISRKAARLVQDKILHLSLEFLNNDGSGMTVDSLVKKMRVRVIGQRPDGRPKRQLVGNLSDVILH